MVKPEGAIDGDRSVNRAMLSTLALAGSLIAGCGQPATQPFESGVGRNPSLPPPESSLIPTVNIAPATGWPEGRQPVAADGLKVSLFAAGLDHPRWLTILPNGDVLVAESRAPKTEGGSGNPIRQWIMGLLMKQAGSAGDSADRITLLRDADGDGVAEKHTMFLTDQKSPFGMALVNQTLYIANTDALVRVPYQQGDTQARGKPETVLDLPAGPINHHWTKNIIASPDGESLYVTVGSNSNVAENGLEAEQMRAAIHQIDLAEPELKPFATGLRNPNGLAWEPGTGALWTTVNERDEIGSDLVPDYLTAVSQGQFFGWPWSYFGDHVDERVEPPRPDLVATAVVPDYALGPHTASLGLAFSNSASDLPAAYAHGAFIGQHGSWNREPRSGYKVVFVPFKAGKPDGQPVDILTGFVDEEGNALGRPAGVAIDNRGGLLVADDVGNRIWRVTTAR